MGRHPEDEPADASDVGGADSADEADSADAADDVPTHEVFAALAVIRSQVAVLAGAAGRAWSLSDSQLREAVAAGAAAKAALDGAWLAVVKALDDRPTTLSGTPVVGADGQPLPGRGARGFLIEALRFSPGQAAADVAAAHALDAETGDLPEMGAALADGAVTRAHADAAVRVARDLPRRLATAVDPQTGLTGMAAADAFLAEHARCQSPRTVAWLGEQLLARLAPDRADRYDPDALTRRTATRAWDSTGMLRGSFQMDGAAGAEFTAIWDALAAPHPAGTAVDDDGQQVLLPDERTQAVRRVDALAAMGRLAAAHLRLGSQGRGPGGPAPDGSASGGTGSGRSGSGGTASDDAPSVKAHVAVTATTEQLAAAHAAAQAAADGTAGTRSLPDGTDSTGPTDTGPTDTGPGDTGPSDSGPGDSRPSDSGLAHQHTGHRGPIPAWLLARLACDATLQRVLLSPGGAVLDLGRRVRLATPGQRRALTARDGGCAVPGCTAPPENCDIHHAIAWSHGGRTDLENLIMLCPRHHSAVHAGQWRVCMRNGIPWLIPPPWIDPQRRPLRNTAHHTGRAAAMLGAQLRLLLDGDP